MNGAELLSNGDPTEAEMVRDSLLAQANLAREDPAVFFDFVMRDFSENKRIKLAPHQRVALDFAMEHDRCVIIAPIGTAKTFLAVGLTLFLLGQDRTSRGGVVSATEAQAAKIVKVVRDYIEQSQELRLVFPELRQSFRDGDPWTQTALTVDRPPGLKDPSLSAYGLDSGLITGSRLKWLVIDDVLNRENVSTNDQRVKVKEWIESSALSRLDPKGGRIIFMNTTWHPDDAINQAEKAGWASMRMDAYGDIFIQDDIMDEIRAETVGVPFEPWDSEHLRPADDNPENPACRLTAHDPDPSNSVTLWPDRYSHAFLEEKRRTILPVIFNQQYRSQSRDDASAMCKQEYIDKCLKVARDLGVYSMVSEYTGSNLTFTGVDLAVSPGEENDDTAFFTFEARPDGMNVILDLQVFQSTGPDILKKLFEVQKRYNSIVRVESNAAQMYIKQFALAEDLSFPLYPHVTGRAKAHPEHGVPGFFGEMMNGAWALPNTRHGIKHPEISRLCDASLYYSPSKHTADILMACYFAREQKRAFLGAGGKPGNANAGGNVAASVLTR